MIGYVVKRLLLAFPTLLGVATVTFVLSRSIPGDPVYGLVGEQAPAEVIAAHREMMGLDQSLPRQYWRFLAAAAPFRRPSIAHYRAGPFRIPYPSFLKMPYLGRSYYARRPVAEMLLEKFPNTLKLALAALLIGVTAGVGLGFLAAARHNRAADRLATAGAVAGISFPVFWTGLILVLVFSHWLGWFPASGMGRGALVFLVLPAVTLGSRSAAFIARITRSSLLEVASENYVTAARAKGLSPARITFKHVFRNAMVPVVTLAGLDFGSYLNGAVLTETIFAWDGIGRMAMTAIGQRDYPVIIGCVLLGAVVFVAVNIVVDISYRLIDPRVKYQPREA